MCLPCPDNPLMNASRDAVELKLDEDDAEPLLEPLETLETPVWGVLTAIAADVGSLGRAPSRSPVDPDVAATTPPAAPSCCSAKNKKNEPIAPRMMCCS